jgi:hypothetical protein
MKNEQYQQWLNSRDDVLKKLPSEVDEPTRAALDFSPASLRAVGDYLVRSFPSLQDLHRAENRSQHLGLSTYAFEVFRRNLHMEPRLPQDDPKYQYYEVPVLRRPNGPDISPFDLVTFTVHRKQPGLLAEVFQNQKEDADRAPKHSNGPVIARPAVPAMSEEEFATWLTFLTDRLENFFDSVDESVRKRLDLSPESLQFVGEALASGTFGEEAADPEHPLFENVYSYVAEVFHRNLGSQFVLPNTLGDPAFGQPSIRDASGATISVPGIVLATATRRDPKLLAATFAHVRDGWATPQGKPH